MKAHTVILCIGTWLVAACGTVKYNAGEVKASALSTLEVDENAIAYHDIYEYIQGKVPGVMVRGDKIIIRGVSTIAQSTDPLFIVDGVPMESIGWVNPNNVKSISVLKDGSECAIYGSRGANGVIVITTK